MRAVPFAVAVMALLCGTASAGDRHPFCTTEPPAHWMSVAAISGKATAAGYRDVKSIRIEGSCYEISAMTSQRQRADVVMNPVTGDVVMAETRD